MYSNRCVLLLGSNLGDKKNNLDLALTLIRKEIGKIKKKTKIVETEAVEYISDNGFLNQAIEVITNLSPFQLLKTAKSIENRLGRKKDTLLQKSYQDRTIDIDIVYFSNIVFKSNTLQIPHIKHSLYRKFSIELLESLNSVI